MSNPDLAQQFKELLDITIDPHLVTIEDGSHTGMDWHGTIDGDSGQRAIASVTWVDIEDGVTSHEFDYCNLHHFLATVGINPNVDHGHGVTVQLSPIWFAAA